MSEDGSELTAELIVDGAAPQQPVISPDGRWVAYVVAPVGWGGERRLSALWVAAADGSPAPRKHGEDDTNVPLGQAIYFHRALTRFGAEHEFVVYPREGHGLTERNHQLDLLRRMRAWFDRWLGHPFP